MRVEYTSRFRKDVKRLRKKSFAMGPLRDVIKLIERNDADSLEELRRRHRMHALKGVWAGANECHIANLEDSLLVWQTANGVAVLLRTGTHQEIFR